MNDWIKTEQRRNNIDMKSLSCLPLNVASITPLALCGCGDLIFLSDLVTHQKQWSSPKRNWCLSSKVVSLVVKPSLVVGRHEVKNSSPFCLGFVSSTIVQNELVSFIQDRHLSSIRKRHLSLHQKLHC